jgi:WD40 repeat protein
VLNFVLMNLTAVSQHTHRSNRAEILVTSSNTQRALHSLLLTTVLVLLATLAALAAGGKSDGQPVIELVPMMGHSQPVYAVAFSPDGSRVVSGSGDHSSKLWDVATGRLLRTLTARSGNVNSVAFSPDGRLVATATLESLELWDVASGRLLRRLSGSAPITFSRDGGRLASRGAAAGYGLVVWDVASGRELRKLEGHTDLVNSIAFSPNGALLLSGGNDSAIKLWDAVAGRLIRTFENFDHINSVAFSPDGVLAVSGSDHNRTRLWEVASGRLLYTFETQPSNAIKSVAFSPDGGSVISAKYDGSISVFDLATKTLVRTISDYPIWSMAVSPDGERVLSGSLDTIVKLWDVKSGALLRSFGAHPNRVSSVALSPDGGRILSASGRDTIALWDTSTGRLLRAIDSGYSSIGTYTNQVAFSPDGRLFASAAPSETVAQSERGHPSVKLWEAATGELVRTFEGHSPIAFSPDGSHIVSGRRGNINLWETRTGQIVRTIQPGDITPESFAFSPDGARLVIGGNEHPSAKDSTIKLWDLATGRLVRSFEGHRVAQSEKVWVGGHFTTSVDNVSVNSVAVSPTGASILSGSGQFAGGPAESTVKLWDLASGRLLRTFKGHLASVRAVAFAGDETHVASASEDDTIKLWDTRSGQLSRSFEGHFSDVRSLQISKQANRLVSGSDDGTIKIWRLDTGEPLATMLLAADGEWLTITPQGFFDASLHGGQELSVVRGLGITTIGQVRQSLFSPDLVREALAGDPDGEFKRAAELINLDKVIDSGPAPLVEITWPGSNGNSATDLVTVAAHIKDRGKGIGRIEWRVNGITTAVAKAPPDAGSEYEVKQSLALDPGNNSIEVVAYNARNLLASLPAQATITYNAPANAEKPKLYVLAIGVNSYHDEGWTPPGATKRESFPPLKLAVDDARSIGEAFRSAGEGLYKQVIVRTALDEKATAAGLERIVQEISAEISPRDTFVLFAAAHGYSNSGRFYLLPQDYQGGTDPAALTSRAIGQDRLQDWIANRIKARRGIILLDTCESGALTNGYAHSRTDAPASEAAVGRLHEATGRPVLTAAAAGKPAFEGYRGHGVFTWTLIDALLNGDTNGNGLIELSELATHVQNTVPKISAEMNGRGIAEVLTQLLTKQDRQRAHFGSTGDDFPLVRRLQ